jgi:murein DD-endopeptidase MepM/ murein hydrolase activator NlpD
MTPPTAARFAFGILLAAVAGLALLAPQSLVAQDPGSAVHTVQRGETLSTIAQARLGSAARWREIHELNRDRIPNPDRIAPGMELRLPGTATDARVTGVQVQQPGAAPRTPPPADYRERRALLERQRFEPRASPQPDESTRTIFYGSPARQVQAEGLSQVILLPESEVPAVQPGVARAAGWVAADESAVGEVGQIRRYAHERALRMEAGTLLVGDEAVLRQAPGATLRPGDVFTTVRAPRRVNGVGLVVVPTGEATVVRVEGGEAVIRVTDAWDAVTLGQFLVPGRENPVRIGVMPGPASRTLDARIVAFEDSKELYLVGDRLFIDRGRQDGLSVGDEFAAMAATTASTDPGNAVLATFQVVRLDEGHATLRMTRTNQPREIRVGIPLVLTAEMP